MILVGGDECWYESKECVQRQCEREGEDDECEIFVICSVDQRVDMIVG